MTEVNEAVKVAKVASKMPGGMKIVGISAGATLALGAGVYFGGKKIASKIKAMKSKKVPVDSEPIEE